MHNAFKNALEYDTSDSLLFDQKVNSWIHRGLSASRSIRQTPMAASTKLPKYAYYPLPTRASNSLDHEDSNRVSQGYDDSHNSWLRKQMFASMAAYHTSLTSSTSSPKHAYNSLDHEDSNPVSQGYDNSHNSWLHKQMSASMAARRTSSASSTSLPTGAPSLRTEL